MKGDNTFVIIFVIYAVEKEYLGPNNFNISTFCNILYNLIYYVIWFLITGNEYFNECIIYFQIQV